MDFYYKRIAFAAIVGLLILIVTSVIASALDISFVIVFFTYLTIMIILLGVAAIVCGKDR